jgi:hypothetical protein
LIVRSKPMAYDGIERQAVEAVGRAVGDGAALRAVAERFPNSRAAPVALFGAAQLAEAAGDQRLAGRTLRELAASHPKFERRAEVFESMARVEAAAGRLDATVARLSVAAREFPEHRLATNLRLSDGAVVAGSGQSFAEAFVAARAVLSRREQAALPDIRLPSRQEMADARKEGKGLKPVTPATRPVVSPVLDFVPRVGGLRREDRTVVQLAASEIAVVSGGGEMLWRGRGPGVRATGYAWQDDTLLVWDAGAIEARSVAAPGGRPLWRVELRSVAVVQPLPPIDAVAVVDTTDEIIEFNVNRNILLLGGNVAGVRVAIPAPEFDNEARRGERITDVAVVDGRVVLGTDAGRLLCVSTDDGKVRWQVRVAGHSVGRVEAGPDFVAAVMAGQGTSQLIAAEVEGGQAVFRRSFGPWGEDLLNLALSPEGVLVFTQRQRLGAKNLFEPGPGLTFQSRAENRDVFAGLGGPGQLVIWEGVALAVGGQTIRAYPLSDAGREARPGDREARPGDREARPGGREAVLGGKESLPLSTLAARGDDTVRLEPVGTQLYVSNSRAMLSYDLGDGSMHWKMDTDSSRQRIDSAVVARSFMLAVARTDGRTPQPDQAAGAVPQLRVLAVSTERSGRTNQESGLFLHAIDVPDIAPGRETLPVRVLEGGILYISRTAELRVLRTQ